MTISTWPAIGRQFVLWTIVSAFLVLGAAVDSGARAEAAEPPSLDSIKSSLDEIESSVGSDEITAEALATFRETLNRRRTHCGPRSMNSSHARARRRSA